MFLTNNMWGLKDRKQVISISIPLIKGWADLKS